MSVTNGQDANQTTFNDGFLSRKVDSDTIGVVGLRNVANPDSGQLIDNAQRLINEIRDTVGITGEGDATRKTYSSNNVVTDTNDHKTSIGDLDERFNGTTGHSHDGTDGEGPQISADNLADFNNLFSEFQEQSFTGASGTSIDVSADFAAKTPGGDSNTAGVITTAPNNSVAIVDSDFGEVEDGSGRRVFGRLTEAAGTWTLSFYVYIAGVETAHSLSSTDINYLYREVFSGADRPTIGANVGVYDSFNATGDIPDATASQRGLVSTGGQVWAGTKQFQSLPNVLGVDLVTLSEVQTLTNKTLTSPDINGGSFEGGTASASNFLNAPENTTANLTALTRQAGNIYWSTDELKYYGDDGTDLVEFGAGGGGGGSGALNFNPIPLAADDDTANYTEGSDPIFDNGGASSSTFSISSAAGDLIFGSASYKLVLNATPGNSDDDYVASQSIAIPQGFRGRFLVFKFRYNYDGADNDIKIVVEDNTNTAILYEANLGSFSNSENTAQDFSFTFYCPDNCDAIKFGPQVITHASGSEELVWNIVEISPDLLITADLDNNTPWEVVPSPASLLSSGFGTTSAVEAYYRYVGDSMQGVFTWRNGTVNATQAFVTLPDNAVIKSGLGSLYQHVGGFKNGNATGDNYHVIARSGDSTVHPVRGGIGPFIPQAASGVFNNNEYNAIFFEVPIEGRASKSTNIISANESILPTKYSSDAGQVIPNGAITVLDFEDREFDPNALVTTGASWQYEVPSNGYYKVTAARRWEATTADYGTTLFLYLDGTAVSRLWSNTPKDMDATNNNIFVAGSDTVYAQKGQLIDIRISQSSGGNLAFTTNPVENYVTISKEDVKPLSAIPVPLVAHVKEVQPGIVNGGSVTGGGTFQTRTLNTIEGDSEFLSLSSNQVTLQSGEYDIYAVAPAFLVANHVLRWRNITDSTTDIIGQNARANADAQTNAVLEGRIKISSAKTYELQHAGTLARATDGFGNADSISGSSVFSMVKITKRI